MSSTAVAGAPSTVSPQPLIASPAFRGFAIVVAVLGPLLMSVSLFASPWGPTDDIPTSVAKIAAAPLAATVSALSIMLSAVFGAAGSLVVAAGVRAGAPRLGAIAGGVAFVGWVAVAYPGPIGAIAASEAAGLSAPQTLALVAGIDLQLTGLVFSSLFVLVPAGILLLGIAGMVASRRRRGGRYPRWVAILLVVAIPLVIACGLLPGKVLAVSWIFVAAAYGAGAWAYGRAARVASAAGPARPSVA